MDHLDAVAKLAERAAQLIVALGIEVGRNEVGRVQQQADPVGGKGGEDFLRHFHGAHDMRVVRLQCHPPADRLDDRQENFADGAVEVRNGLGGVVARIVAGELSPSSFRSR